MVSQPINLKIQFPSNATPFLLYTSQVGPSFHVTKIQLHQQMVSHHVRASTWHLSVPVCSSAARPPISATASPTNHSTISSSISHTILSSSSTNTFSPDLPKSVSINESMSSRTRQSAAGKPSILLHSSSTNGSCSFHGRKSKWGLKIPAKSSSTSWKISFLLHRRLKTVLPAAKAAELVVGLVAGSKSSSWWKIEGSMGCEGVNHSAIVSGLALLTIPARLRILWM